LERRKTHEKKTAGGKADACGNTAGIFYCRPVSVFYSLCRYQMGLFSPNVYTLHTPVEWNSFLTVTAVLLIFTCFFGRHFCGYACAFGSFGDAVYEGFSWIRMKCFHKKKKPALSEKMVHGLQKVKYIVLALILLSCLTGVYGKLTGTSPWDVFSMLTARRLPNSKYLVGIVFLVLIIVGMCTQERFFCQFLCPMGAVFALMPILPGALFRRNREKCPPKCGLCKKRCPAHLDIDGDTGRSGECLCCHACAAACPRKNIHIGTIEEK